MTVGEILKNRRKEKKISLRQLAYKVEFSHTNIADIEKGIVRKADSIEKLMVALDFSEGEKKNILLKLDYEKIPASIKEKLNNSNENFMTASIVELPVYGKAAAGNGYLNMSNILRMEYITVLPGEDFPLGAFIVEVTGELMFPTLLDGDFAIVDPNCNNVNMNNQICVITYNGQTYIKRISIKEKYIVLISDNPDRKNYEDIIVPINEFSDLKCEGIVIECKRRFRRR